MEIHVHDTPEILLICEKHFRGMCPHGPRCPEHHSPLPYLWQVCLDWQGWTTLKLEESEHLEIKYADPKNETCFSVIELPDANGQLMKLDGMANYTLMQVAVRPVGQASSTPHNLPLRRLSTMTYVRSVGEKDNLEDTTTPKYSTQWRWYYKDLSHHNNNWLPFEQDGFTPMQWTIEEKYEAGQEIYRFEVNIPPRGLEIYMINLTQMQICNPRRKQVTEIRRRPLPLGQADMLASKCLSYPARKLAPFSSNLPSNWFPVDPKSEFELVPLNPNNIEYHLVASELIKSLPKDRKIYDIFRLQNAYLWHKYHSKKLMLEQKNVDTNELQLFHGTHPESTVQAIFRQNFDWRLSGKNNIVYGKGSYFARDASYSDKYTGNPGPGQYRWMFMARVIAGRYIRGNSSYVRPPPIDATNPQSDLYDSCVDREHHPNIYVIFDNDQVYPEYVISYR